MPEQEPPSEALNATEVINHFNQLVNSWDFSGHNHLDNGHFTVHIAHWAAEVFGQQNESGRYFVDPGHDYGEGFTAQDMPQGLRQLTMYAYNGNLYETNHNSVRISTATETMETDPYIPKWDELSQTPSFKDMVARARSDPEVMAMLMPGKFEVIPRVDIIFKPSVEQQWGLQFIVRPNGVEALPFGSVGHTKIPFEFAREACGNPSELMRSTAELLIVALRNTDYTLVRFADPSMLDILNTRLTGATSIPLGDVAIDSTPRNGIKNLLIRELMEPQLEIDE